MVFKSHILGYDLSLHDTYRVGRGVFVLVASSVTKD